MYLNVLFAFSNIFLRKTGNRMGPGIEPCGTPSGTSRVSELSATWKPVYVGFDNGLEKDVNGTCFQF